MVLALSATATSVALADPAMLPRMASDMPRARSSRSLAVSTDWMCWLVEPPTSTGWRLRASRPDSAKTYMSGAFTTS